MSPPSACNDELSYTYYHEPKISFFQPDPTILWDSTLLHLILGSHELCLLRSCSLFPWQSLSFLLVVVAVRCRYFSHALSNTDLFSHARSPILYGSGSHLLRNVILYAPILRDTLLSQHLMTVIHALSSHNVANTPN